jgi:hypothetical protein
VLPKYLPSVQLLDFSSLSFYAMAVTIGASSVYVALERQVLNGLLLLGGMAITVILGLIFVNMGKGTLGVAMASAMSSCAYLVVFLVCGLRMVGRSGRGLFRDLTIVLLPMTLCVGSVVALESASRTGFSRLPLTIFLLAATSVLALWGTRTFMHAPPRSA